MKKLFFPLFVALLALLYASCSSDGGNLEPSSSGDEYHFKTGAYIEASRNETFSICPDKKAEGTWISEYSVSINAIGIIAGEL